MLARAVLLHLEKILLRVASDLNYGLGPDERLDLLPVSIEPAQSQTYIGHRSNPHFSAAPASSSSSSSSPSSSQSGRHATVTYMYVVVPSTAGASILSAADRTSPRPRRSKGTVRRIAPRERASFVRSSDLCLGNKTHGRRCFGMSRGELILALSRGN